MRGYNKDLKNFIAYVFKKYKKDENVQKFKELYEVKQQEDETKRLQRLENIKQKPLNCSVEISSKTANLCISLVNNELEKQYHTQCFTETYIDSLNVAIDELYGNYNNAVKKLLEVMKRNV